jgi:hypothetical protein
MCRFKIYFQGPRKNVFPNTLGGKKKMVRTKIDLNAKTSETLYSLGRKGFLTVFVVILLFAAFSMTVSANPGAINVPGDYTTIQEAISNAGDGDLIVVEPGRYNETVEVSVSNVTLKANATDPAETIVSANGTSDQVFTIVGQTNVTLTGFTIRDARVAGIFMNNARDCAFSDNIVTDIFATGSNNRAYGIFLFESYNNSFSSMTIANITADDTAYGMYLNQSDDNTFAAVTIRPTISGNDYYEFYSEVGSDENVATDVTLGNPTTISFTYAKGIWVKRVSAADEPADPPNFGNIGKYITAGNLSSNSWLFVNFRYSPEDVTSGEVDESSLKVWKYNGTTWVENGWNESRFLDTANNVVGVNITSFSLFAPLGSKLAEPGESISVTIKPETLNLASKGKFTAFIQFPEGFDVSQIHLSTVSCEGAPAVKGIAVGNVYLAKFNRRALANVATGNVTLTVTGEFKDGTPFEGSDVIRVIDQGKQIVPETELTTDMKNGQNKGPKNNNGKSKGNSKGKSKGTKK